MTHKSQSERGLSLLHHFFQISIYQIWNSRIPIHHGQLLRTSAVLNNASLPWLRWGDFTRKTWGFGSGGNPKSDAKTVVFDHFIQWIQYDFRFLLGGCDDWRYFWSSLIRFPFHDVARRGVRDDFSLRCLWSELWHPQTCLSNPQIPAMSFQRVKRLHGSWPMSPGAPGRVEDGGSTKQEYLVTSTSEEAGCNHSKWSKWD